MSFLDTEYHTEDAALMECAILALDLDKPQSLLAAQEVLSDSTVARFHTALMQRDDEAQVIRNDSFGEKNTVTICSVHACARCLSTAACSVVVFTCRMYWIR